MLLSRFMPPVLCLALVAALTATSARADAITGIGFTRITSNSADDVASQLNLDILDWESANALYHLGLESNQVLFLYTNAVGIQSCISEVFIDDGTVVFQSAVHNSLGGFTSFVGGGSNPGNLPSGNNVDPVFVATNTFSADAVGNPGKGVNSADDILGVS